jgi:hypothetical protein
MDWSSLVTTTAKILGLAQSQKLVSQFLAEWTAAGRSIYGIKVREYASVNAILEASPSEQVEIALRALQLAAESDDWQVRHALEALYTGLLRKNLPFRDEQIVELARLIAIFKHDYFGPSKEILGTLERWSSKNQLPTSAIEHLRIARSEYPETLSTASARQALKRLDSLIGGESRVPIIPGEPWSDLATAHLEGMPTEDRGRWMALLTHCQTSSGSPSTKWSKEAGKGVEVIGRDEFRRRMLGWLPLVDKPRQVPQGQNLHPMSMIYANVDLLRGLAWCCGKFDDAEMARLLGFVAISSYKKGPGFGPRAIKLGNACVYSLGAMAGSEGLAQLALLKVKIKFGTAQQGIEKALRAVATRLGLSREEIEELAVPTYGMDDVGIRREVVGDFTAELAAHADGSTTLQWRKGNGKAQKAVPAAVKEQFAEELEELKAAAKDLQKMLPAQKERVDGLFMAQKRWPRAVWRERYLDHPLMGIIARRLIWVFTVGDMPKAGCWLDGRLVDMNDQPLELDESAAVELWHPIGRSTEEIIGWRQWLERHEIQQPLKQAHREVYVLTDAERRTETYSNRFAAHLIRQHQFNALCSQRGWKNKLRLMVDAEYPAPSRSLPQWGLRAEFWVDSAGTEFGVDTNETGTYLYLATDQVRFYPIDAEEMYAHASGGGYGLGWRRGAAPQPLRLEEIPQLVLSEIMRDVDLFVGVASVGNDPTWADGGPGGRYVDYWQRYSFGELSGSAQTRKSVLERIVPRLKIADRCSFMDRFLVVRGDLRTYKVHLGSGNILMEPNDQYLCIVPDRRLSTRGERVFLPFEGDATLSIILSKALLLAADMKITDPTITRQIAGR